MHHASDHSIIIPWLGGSFSACDHELLAPRVRSGPKILQKEIHPHGSAQTSSSEHILITQLTRRLEEPFVD